MRRIHTTYDLLDAHVLTALLREHGIDAWLFDADFVRQNWLQSIAYGGYRILVRDEDVGTARELLQQHAETLVLEQDTAEPCPACAHASGVDDPQPRRNVFLALILYGVFGDVLFLWMSRPSPAHLVFTFALLLVINVSVPWLFMVYFKWRLGCTNCGYRWREPPQHSHAELTRMAEAADTAA